MHLAGEIETSVETTQPADREVTHEHESKASTRSLQLRCERSFALFHREVRRSALIYFFAGASPFTPTHAASAASAAGLSLAQLARASAVGAESALSIAFASLASA